jgi:hypothetical protein
MPITAHYTAPDMATRSQVSEMETLLSGALWEGNWPDFNGMTFEEAQFLIEYLRTIQAHPVTERGVYGANELNQHIKTISGYEPTANNNRKVLHCLK